MLRAALAARPGQPVPFDELIDAVWGDEKPANPKGALRNLVQRLRATDQCRSRARELARVTGRRSWERRLQPPANGGSTSS